ncbi:hypothetical protein [Glutamicibacter sp. NPDC087344]|uniref:hypothetical protein n=1 Tax=Glutamicibacter sp. NPDC087344 TaxID=3363994 RepID=UPI003822EC83
MTNTPWEAASPHYKKIVFISMGTIGLGIILTVIGSLNHLQPLLFLAIGLLVIGMLFHIAGLVVRARDVRNWRIANGLATPRTKKTKDSGAN